MTLPGVPKSSGAGWLGTISAITAIAAIWLVVMAFFSLQGWLAILLINPGLFIYIGIGALYGRMSRFRRVQRLLDTGTFIHGQISGVMTTEPGPKESRKWRIRCEVYLQGSETPISCLTKDLDNNPAPTIKESGIRWLPIFLDLADPENHLVDDSQIRKRLEALPSWTEVAL
jgi:hypothetical protein